MNMLDIFNKGGPVVWVLLGFSVIALSIALERYWYFLRMGRLPSGFVARFQDELHGGNPESLLKGLQGPEVAVISELLAASKQGVHDLVRIATRVGSRELQAMQRGFRTLGLLGDTAPLLGLFGTITGLIKAFIVIEQAGGKVDAQALAGGIWEAMVTTGVGLAVALPILFLLHWLEGIAHRRSSHMQYIAALIIESSNHTVSTPNVMAMHDGIQHSQDVAYGV